MFTKFVNATLKAQHILFLVLFLDSHPLFSVLYRRWKDEAKQQPYLFKPPFCRYAKHEKARS